MLIYCNSLIYLLGFEGWDGAKGRGEEQGHGYGYGLEDNNTYWEDDKGRTCKYAWIASPTNGEDILVVSAWIADPTNGKDYWRGQCCYFHGMRLETILQLKKS